MSVELHKGARPDEHFFLNPINGMPAPVVTQHWWGRKVQWVNVVNEDGSPGNFTSWAFLRFLRVYRGKPKCDATRTSMYWSGQCGTPEAGEPPIDLTRVVLCDTQKEQFSVRFLWFTSPSAVDQDTWRNMGGFW